MMVLGESKRVGDLCPNPKCRRPLERKKEAFYWRGEYKDGAYCRPCNSLWAIDGEEIEPLKLARRPTTIEAEEV